MPALPAVSTITHISTTSTITITSAPVPPALGQGPSISVVGHVRESGLSLWRCDTELRKLCRETQQGFSVSLKIAVHMQHFNVF